MKRHTTNYKLKGVQPIYTLKRREVKKIYISLQPWQKG